MKPSWHKADIPRCPTAFGVKRTVAGRRCGFALETAFELILFGLVPLFLTLATVWILWHSVDNPDEVTRHSDNGIRNHRVVGLVSNHRGGGCDRSESKGQKEPTYSVDLKPTLRLARLVQV